MMESKKDFIGRGIRDGLPIGLGYFAVSFSFGIMAKNAGLSAGQATLMSATNYTSAGQFAALGLIAASAPYVEMAVTQLIINLRYCLMSCALSQKLEDKMPFFHRLFMAMGVTDEIFGVCACVKGKLSPWYMYGVMAPAMFGWSLGTLLGTISGSILSQRVVRALSVALYGMFLAVILPPARKDKVLAGLIVIAMTASFLFAKLPVVSGISSGFKIILLTLLLAGAAAYFFPLKEDTDEK